MAITKRIQRFLLIMVLLFIGKKAFTNVAFYHFRIENGRAESKIVSISQYSTGLIRLSGENGLYRLNRNQFQEHQNATKRSSTVPFIRTIALFTDSSRKFWGGSNNRLSYYNAHNNEFIEFGKKLGPLRIPDIFAEKPFYMTTGFYILIVVVFIALTWGVLRTRSKMLFLRQKQLEQIIQERTSELKQKNEELVLANQTKDKFFSIISHDLRSPFSGLLGLLDLLTDPENSFDTSTQKELLQSAKSSAYNTYELLENLLLWARSQMRTTTTSVKKQNLSEMLKKNIDLKKQIADQKKISLSGCFPENLEALFDREMINTVIRNLLSNAIKFTPPGGKIKLYAFSKNGEIRVSIADNGIGTDTTEPDKLFTLDKTSRTGTSGEKGTGLGLVICKEFVKTNYGKIWAEPNKPKGTIFHFTLPATNN